MGKSRAASLAFASWSTSSDILSVNVFAYSIVAAHSCTPAGKHSLTWFTHNTEIAHENRGKGDLKNQGEKKSYFLSIQ